MAELVVGATTGRAKLALRRRAQFLKISFLAFMGLAGAPLEDGGEGEGDEDNFKHVINAHF